MLNSDPEKFLQTSITDNHINAVEIEKMIALRKKARKNKDWLLADKIRLDLDNLGIVIEDDVTDTTWRKK